MALFSSETESEQQVDPMRRDQVSGWQNRYFNLLDQPFSFFPDQTYADLTPEQLQALEMREDVAGDFGAGIMDPTYQAWGSTLTAPDVAANPYVNAMLDRQRHGIMTSLEEDVMPMIRSRSIGAGALGGGRQGVAEGIAAGKALDALADAQAQTQLGAYGQGLQQQRYGIGAAPGMAGLQLTPSDIMMGVGGVRQAQDQLGIDEAMARHEFEQNEPWARMERFVQPYQHMSAPYTTTKSQSETTPSGLQIAGQLGGAALMGGLGLGAMGYGPAAGMFSGAGGAAAGAAPMMAPDAGNMGNMLSMANMGRNAVTPEAMGRGWGGYVPRTMYSGGYGV